LVKLPSIARRMRGTAEAVSNGHSTETVVCGKCGQRFAIRRDLASLDVELAKKQVSFVTEQLVWDHIQERKHHGTIELPDV
jgi:transcription elongation factor Elf1